MQTILHDAMAAIRKDGALLDCFAREDDGSIAVVAQIPGDLSDPPRPLPRPLDTADVQRVHMRLQNTGFPHFARDGVVRAIELLADSKLPWLEFIQRRNAQDGVWTAQLDRDHPPSRLARAA